MTLRTRRIAGAPLPGAVRRSSEQEGAAGDGQRATCTHVSVVRPPARHLGRTPEPVPVVAAPFGRIEEPATSVVSPTDLSSSASGPPISPTGATNTHLHGVHMRCVRPTTANDKTSAESYPTTYQSVLGWGRP